MLRVLAEIPRLHSGPQAGRADRRAFRAALLPLLLAREADMTISIRASAEEVVLTAAWWSFCWPVRPSFAKKA